jgi:hypothetical protein
MWWLIIPAILLWWFWGELSDSQKEKIIDIIIKFFEGPFKDYYRDNKGG